MNWYIHRQYVASANAARIFITCACVFLYFLRRIHPATARARITQIIRLPSLWDDCDVDVLYWLSVNMIVAILLLFSKTTFQRFPMREIVHPVMITILFLMLNISGFGNGHGEPLITFPGVVNIHVESYRESRWSKGTGD